MATMNQEQRFVDDGLKSSAGSRSKDELFAVAQERAILRGLDSRNRSPR